MAAHHLNLSRLMPPAAEGVLEGSMLRGGAGCHEIRPECGKKAENHLFSGEDGGQGGGEWACTTTISRPGEATMHRPEPIQLPSD